jgi:hypothetical protein
VGYFLQIVLVLAVFHLLQADEGLVFHEAIGLHVYEIDQHGGIGLWTFL